MASLSRRLVLRAALQALMALVFWNPALGQSADAPPPQTTEPQSVQPAPQPPIGMTGGVIVAGPRAGSLTPGFTPTIHQVTGKPYTLEMESEQTQTLADGTHISRKTSVNWEYRDSLGRTRTEREPVFPGHAASTLQMIQITDPVARFRYTLNIRDKIAHRVPATVLPNTPNRAQGHPLRTRAVMRTSATTADTPRPQMKQEPLGTQTFEGILAEGFRTTTTMPVGYMGNDRHRDGLRALDFARTADDGDVQMFRPAIGRDHHAPDSHRDVGTRPILVSGARWVQGGQGYDALVQASVRPVVAP